jgi:hypothetical protein
VNRPRRRSAALCAAVALTALALGAGPASAATWGHNDARKDVVKESVKDGGGSGLTAAPRNKNTDITRIVVRHTQKRVIVRTVFRDLTRDTGYNFFYLRTSTGDFETYHVLGRGVPNRVSRLAPGESVYINGAGGEVACPGAEGLANRRKDFALMSIPRSCLGGPSWIRVGGGTLTYDVVSGRLFIDGARVKGLSADSAEQEFFRLSPKVHRG